MDCEKLYLIIMCGEGSGSALFSSLIMKKARQAATTKERKEMQILICWGRPPMLPVQRMMWICRSS